MKTEDTRPAIFVINGSASERSANQKLINNFAGQMKEYFDVDIFNSLKTLPHFDPELSIENTPKVILDFRASIEKADAVLICTPEYVFSIPSGLKNAIEWCVSTTVFSNKPTGLITASASGRKGHEELQLIMKTIMAEFTAETTLLISGVKGKLNENGEITDKKTKEDFEAFINSFKAMVEK
ncbi:NADPH-dependent FMN reductase [Lacibacter sp.]|uniref:NADPH-dependent FMN reductase n=1 Tax=Lacibacter sp. TaxID=1915409 RepID=UPI002B4B38DB|nr:NADPH-dependent FMN reductase [Lacibacter sp.]HLP35523.1 NADPH-dependent FMN reductase [Lacibacter sp.]